MTEDKRLTVQELYDVLKTLVEKGKGDLPVFVTYETVFAQAHQVEVVTSGKYNNGVYIGE